MKKCISLLLSLLIVVSLFIVPVEAAEYTVDDGALVVSATTTLNAQIALNIYVALPDSVLAAATPLGSR